MLAYQRRSYVIDVNPFTGKVTVAIPMDERNQITTENTVQ